VYPVPTGPDLADGRGSPNRPVSRPSPAERGRRGRLSEHMV